MYEVFCFRTELAVAVSCLHTLGHAEDIGDVIQLLRLIKLIPDQDPRFSLRLLMSEERKRQVWREERKHADVTFKINSDVCSGHLVTTEQHVTQYNYQIAPSVCLYLLFTCGHSLCHFRKSCLSMLLVKAAGCVFHCGFYFISSNRKLLSLFWCLVLPCLASSVSTGWITLI